MNIQPNPPNFRLADVKVCANCVHFYQIIADDGSCVDITECKKHEDDTWYIWTCDDWEDEHEHTN